MTSKTISLTGNELAVTGLSGANAHIRNDSTSVVYAAKMPGISAGADEVTPIPAGQSVSVRGIIGGAVYLLGTGSVYIQSDDIASSPFRNSAASGGSGADSVARAAIESHSADTDIHVTAEEKAGWNALSNPNFLINPDFCINQRGLTEYTGPTYTVDCWRKNAGGTVRVGDCLILSKDALVRQPLEYSDKLSGQPITLSININGKVHSKSSVCPSDTSSFAFYWDDNVAVTRYINDNATWLVVTAKTDNVEISWIKLELGSAATPFLPPDPATELMKCQRYFVRYGTAYGWFGTGFTSATNRARLSQALPVPLRSGVIRPTVTVHGTLYINTPTKLGVDALILGDFIDSPIIQNNNLCMGFVIPDGTGTVESCYGQLRDNDSYIDISAEL